MRGCGGCVRSKAVMKIEKIRLRQARKKVEALGVSQGLVRVKEEIMGVKLKRF